MAAYCPNCTDSNLFVSAGLYQSNNVDVNMQGPSDWGGLRVLSHLTGACSDPAGSSLNCKATLLCGRQLSFPEPPSAPPAELQPPPPPVSSSGGFVCLSTIRTDFCTDRLRGCGALFSSLVTEALEGAASDGTNRILALTDPNSQKVLEEWVRGASYSTNIITYVNSSALVASLNFSQYQLLIIPASPSTTLNNALAAVKGHIATFINMGGSVIVSSQRSYDFLTIALTVEQNLTANFDSGVATSAMADYCSVCNSSNLARSGGLYFKGPSNWGGLNVVAHLTGRCSDPTGPSQDCQATPFPDTTPATFAPLIPATFTTVISFSSTTPISTAFPDATPATFAPLIPATFTTVISFSSTTPISTAFPDTTPATFAPLIPATFTTVISFSSTTPISTAFPDTTPATFAPLIPATFTTVISFSSTTPISTAFPDTTPATFAPLIPATFTTVISFSSTTPISTAFPDTTPATFAPLIPATFTTVISFSSTTPISTAFPDTTPATIAPLIPAAFSTTTFPTTIPTIPSAIASMSPPSPPFPPRPRSPSPPPLPPFPPPSPPKPPLPFNVEVDYNFVKTSPKFKDDSPIDCTNSGDLAADVAKGANLTSQNITITCRAAAGRRRGRAALQAAAEDCTAPKVETDFILKIDPSRDIQQFMKQLYDTLLQSFSDKGMCSLGPLNGSWATTGSSYRTKAVTAATAPPPPSPSSSSGGSTSGKWNSWLAITGLVVGGIGILCALVVFIILVLVYRSRRRQREHNASYATPNDAVVAPDGVGPFFASRNVVQATPPDDPTPVTAMALGATAATAGARGGDVSPPTRRVTPTLIDNDNLGSPATGAAAAAAAAVRPVTTTRAAAPAPASSVASDHDTNTEVMGATPAESQAVVVAAAPVSGASRSSRGPREGQQQQQQQPHPPASSSSSGSRRRDKPPRPNRDTFALEVEVAVKKIPPPPEEADEDSGMDEGRYGSSGSSAITAGAVDPTRQQHRPPMSGRPSGAGSTSSEAAAVTALPGGHGATGAQKRMRPASAARRADNRGSSRSPAKPGRPAPKPDDEIRAPSRLKHDEPISPAGAFSPSAARPSGSRSQRSAPLVAGEERVLSQNALPDGRPRLPPLAVPASSVYNSTEITGSSSRKLILESPPSAVTAAAPAPRTAPSQVAYMDTASPPGTTDGSGRASDSSGGASAGPGPSNPSLRPPRPPKQQQQQREQGPLYQGSTNVPSSTSRTALHVRKNSDSFHREEDLTAELPLRTSGNNSSSAAGAAGGWQNGS
ncbi:hypothetical protein VOLCADRAFT_92053 [Volvox carteri f. nagariensis]|uniref:Uncharacterized protein n=1 Tax=Volvox carteri f. nagariensis TaxID=3068 RepID=D8TYZ7_VOLCA|nr:uncharacterized protein VOLCADRAFT_92053 [Volvox carteri f. nagariensis]EFJ47306.1 hypothetical protein VOLCADRAFT_92053 [Volvox carteri f. nagariensis]|eukprot:XP_002951495.1 hypothetical protein VOLCADRAFT_92053 [Volvox carteri f. nagariensis]